MSDWKEYKLEEICTKITDGSHFSPKALEAGYPMFSVKDMLEYGFDYLKCKYISKEDFLTLKKSGCVPQKGDVLVAKDGSYLKQIFVCKETRDEAILSSIAIFRPNELVDSYFLNYLLKSPQVYNYIANNCVSGSALPRIVLKAFKAVELSIPAIETQQSIASFLKSLDDKIECNRRINENLEQQAQALFKSWFVDFEPFKDQPFVESELGMIPQGWKVGCLDDLCSFISRGLTPKYDETSDELILGQTCVRNNIVTLNNARKHRPKSKTEKWVQQWDILLNSTGIGSLGRVGVVYFNMDNVAIDSHITVVRTSKSLYRHYVGRNLLSRQLEIENMAVGSTGQTELPRDRVKTMTIIVPSDDALTKFNYIIEPMALTMYRNIEENKRLAELRDTLLPRLMSGELKVNDVI